MTPEQYRAGWRLAGDPAARPEPCIGSGQRIAFPIEAGRGAFSTAWDVCPECSRRVQVVRRDGADVLATHQPPESSPGGSARQLPDGPSFGL